MKTDRKTCDPCPPQDRLLSAAIAMLLALSFSASVAFERVTTLAQSNPTRSADSQIDGKLVIDGTVTQLKYVYAQRREAPPPYKGAIVDLFITNEPLPEDLLTQILDEKYHGSDAVRGIWLTFDTSGALTETEFLLQSASVPRRGTGIAMMGGEHKIENDRISGKLEYLNQQVIGTTGFTVTFDAPLNDATVPGKAVTRKAEPKPAVSGHTPAAAPRELGLRGYIFETAAVNSKGAVIKRSTGRARYYVERQGGIRLEMVGIPGGSFTMGSSGVYEAHPAHPVNVPSFYMSKYEVTQAQWRAVANLPRILRHLDPDPSQFKGASLPVERVSREDAIEFCARLSRATGRTYRLPSEAEWEYACRAGTETPYAFGEAINSRLVNYKETYPDGSKPKPAYRVRTTPVGSLGVANRFGLYDMHGNVAEWCMDPWHDFYVRAPGDGSVWEAGGAKTDHVVRGGSWDDRDHLCRADYRFKRSMNDQAGVRLVAARAAEAEPIKPVAEIKPTSAREMAAKGAGGLPLRAYEFDTVTVDLNGVSESRRKGQASYYVEDLKETGLEMVEIPAGAFKMGWSEDDQQRPVHLVKMPSFYLSKYEVTQAEWRAVAKLPKVNRDLKPDPSHFKGVNLPVDSVSWYEAIEFCARLSRATGRTYCLPTEAEWEYACRGGTTSEFAFGDNITPDLVNYDGRFSLGSAPHGVFRKQTTPVGSLGVANGFGLYDMDGNVREWCLDPWHESYKGAPGDGSAWQAGGKPESRVTRGGSWDQPAHMCRAAGRNWCPPDSCRLEYFGFRVVMDGRGCVGLPKEPAKSPEANAKAKPRPTGFLEYRLEAIQSRPSQKFTWSDGSKTLELETRPFMTISDISRARISPALQTPQRYSIDLIHTRQGAEKFRNVANRDRNRSVSILVDGKIVQGYGFPPEQKEVYDRGATIYGPFTLEQATALARKISAAIRAASARHKRLQ